MRLRVLSLALLVLVGLAAPSAALEVDASTPAKAAQRGGGPEGDRYVVLLRDGSDVPKVLARLERKVAMKAEHAYRHAVRGFSARLSPSQRHALAADGAVAAIVADETFTLAAQIVPTGVARVGGKTSEIAAIDGVDRRVDADVAIVDTGITPQPDLNVVGGHNCTTADPAAWTDQNGHGTHVAGTVGALDNDFGVVGVAPGARLWAVKILGADGSGLLSWYVCGLDWILAQRDPLDASRPLFEVANMSLGKPGSDDHACGTTNGDVLHRAICRLVGGGVTVVAAAMNYSSSAAGYIPAAYDEVITVSALADTDGKPGGLGGHRCYSWGGWDVDDTFADFSDYGSDVDIIAPGKCIWSTVPGGYGYKSGTSMATPAVAGAAALYKSTHPNATPAEVRVVLRGLGNLNWATATDPDRYHEPLLDVSRIGGPGDFAIHLPAGPLTVDESGGPIPIAIERTPDCFEPVTFRVEGLPAGSTASVTPNAPGGFDATLATLTVGLPATIPSGVFHLTVTGTIQGRSRSAAVDVTFVDQAPVVQSPTVTLGSSPTPSLTAMPLHLAWPPASDPSGVIAGYVLDVAVDGGGWKSLASLPGDRTTYDRLFLPGHDYLFRLVAQDGRGLSSRPARSDKFRFAVFQETNRAVRYAGTWTPMIYDMALGGATRWTTETGASASFSFSGRQVAIVGPKGPTRGRAKVYLDGAYVGTIDQWRSVGWSRQVLMVRILGAGGTHVLKIVALGTAGHPRVEVDGFVVAP